jgi:hypothetical protein
MKNLAKNSIKTVALISAVVLLITNVTFTSSVLGQNKFDAGYKVLAPLPGTCTDDGHGNCVVKTGTPGALSGYINGLYRIVVAGASVLAVLMIIIGGFNYVASDAINNKEEGKSMIKGALGGLLLVFASYIVLNTVNPQLLSLKVGDTQLKSESLMGLATLMNNEAQQQFNFLTNQANAQLADVKVDKQQFLQAIDRYQKTLNGDQTSSDPNARLGLNYIYDQLSNPLLTDEEKMNLFGTTDQDLIEAKKQEIADQIQNANNIIAKSKAQADQIGSFTEVTGSIKNTEASLARGDITDFPLTAQRLKENFEKQTTKMTQRNDVLNGLDPQGAQERNARLAKDLETLKKQTNDAINRVCTKMPLPIITAGEYEGDFVVKQPVYDKIPLENCKKNTI